MKNTGITYTSAERSPVILPEMEQKDHDPVL